MMFGPQIRRDAVLFRLWAPRQQLVLIEVDAAPALRMNRTEDGWHELSVKHAGAGSRYMFQLENGIKIPDPASRYQPEDVHGPSEVVDLAPSLSKSDWNGRPWETAIIYEMHVGTFTPQGTFLAAIERLPWLVELGVTAIELMPVGDFPGQRGWGYDGVLWFAPDASYGRPEHLQQLIQAAHDHGIMVFLDVIYNHFGPDGNYLPLYAPIFNEQHHTPWGAAVNFDADGSDVVRQFVIANALYWLQEFRFDGLRFDAVHAMRDDSGRHLLDELGHLIRAATPGRTVHLILENEENQAERLQRDDQFRPVTFTAQWNDDCHHVLHTAATGEHSGYYGEYAGDTEKLGRALAEGFAFQGDLMQYRGRPRGEPSAHLPPTAFISFIQNHDQVGNRARGDRIHHLASKQAMRAIACVYLLCPQVPMIFMGEEFCASSPFPFFCDFSGDLAQSVRDGRRAEFSKFPEFQDPANLAEIPDATALETFESAKLNWDEVDDPEHRDCVDLYRRLIATRRREIVPRLSGLSGHHGRYEVLDDLAVKVQWELNGATLTLLANLKDRPAPSPRMPPGRTIWSVNDEGASYLSAWAVLWSVKDQDIK